MDLKDSISIEDVSAVAEEGQATNIDNEYSFSRNKQFSRPYQPINRNRGIT
jgi:hypothetical protein